MQAIYDTNTIDVMSDNTIVVKDYIEPGIYKIMGRPMAAPVLVRQPMFPDLPAKRYGKNDRRAQYIMNQFDRTSGANLGAVFVGAKGTGKSLLAKTIALMAHEKKYPVIIIDAPVGRGMINHFLSKITQKCVIIFDEFDKNYDDGNSDGDDNKTTQLGLLTILDGGLVQNKMFLFTANREYSVTEYMRNRPGRVRYLIRFDGLAEDEITAFCDENLQMPEKTECTRKILALARTVKDFSYDQLVSLVDELNTHPDVAVGEILEIFNLKSDRLSGRDSKLDIISIVFDDPSILIKDWRQYQSRIHAHVLDGGMVRLSSFGDSIFKQPMTDIDGTDGRDLDWHFTNNDIIGREPDGTIIFRTDAYKGITLTVRPKPLTYNEAVDFIGF